MSEHTVRYFDSLGAGVQSTTMYLLACEGRRWPMPEAAVFADTGGEPRYVYDHLDRLEEFGKSHDGPPIVRVSAGDLMADTMTKRSVSPPLWVKRSPEWLDAHPTKDRRELVPGGRWCTDKYKTRPILAWLRKEVAVPRGCRTARVYLGLGITTDEETRQKTSNEPWLVYRHPLLTVLDDVDGLGWSRDRCRDYLADRGWGEVPKSACTYCPYHVDELWAEIKALDPEGFAEAVRFDERVRYGTRGDDEEGLTFFVHRTGRPLREVELPPYRPGAASASVGCSPFSCARGGSQISLFEAAL